VPLLPLRTSRRAGNSGIRLSVREVRGVGGDCREGGAGGERESLVARGNSGEPERRMHGARRGAEGREGRIAGGERGGRGGEDGRAVTERDVRERGRKRLGKGEVEERG